MNKYVVAVIEFNYSGVNNKLESKVLYDGEYTELNVFTEKNNLVLFNVVNTELGHVKRHVGIFLTKEEKKEPVKVKKPRQAKAKVGSDAKKPAKSSTELPE